MLVELVVFVEFGEAAQSLKLLCTSHKHPSRLECGHLRVVELDTFQEVVVTVELERDLAEMGRA